MSEAIDTVRRRLLRAAAALAAEGVPYAVVGGNAVAAWVSRVDAGAARNTRDVDLLVRREDLPACIAALEKADFHHRRVESLGRAEAMDVFLDGSKSKVSDAVHIVFAGEKTTANQPEPNAAVTDSEDAGEFRLITLEGLVRMKLSAFRDKDRVHLRDLLAVGLIDASWIDRLPVELRPRLAQIVASPEG